MDAFATALTLLSRRELSSTQLRQRLGRRKFAPHEIDDAVQRLTRDGTLDDRRVALASARVEATVKRRGRRRVIQQVQRLGISAAAATAAADDVFSELDEQALLEQALARRLKGADPRSLDRKAVARIVRSLTSQGFEPGQVYARLRKRGAEADE